MEKMLAMRSVSVMPNPLDTREIFFTNLLLLGFDPSAMESRERIPFNRDMFSLPNKKAMEVVMHFLFSKLSPQMTHEEFRDCWPVKNKVEEQQFRKICYNWVSRIAKEEMGTNFPRVVQSLFHSPGGDRFYNFLQLFSIYVLKVAMLRDHSRHISTPPFPSKSIHNQSFTQVISKSYQLQTGIHRKRFLELAQYSIQVQHHWKSFAVELTKENRNLKKKIKELERQMKGEVKYKGEQMAKSFALNHEYQREADAIKRAQQIQKVRGLWNGIEDFYSAHTPQREVVDSVLEEQANIHQLDATDVQVKIPDLLLREFERDLHKKRIGNTYVSGKLNLLSLIQLWNLSLNLLKDKFRQDSVPSFDKSSPKIKNDVHTHKYLLTNAEDLRSTLTKETIPDLKQSVENLRSKIDQDMVERRGTGGPYPYPYSFDLGLGLAPATPPVSFTAAETPASYRISSFQDSLKRTPVGVSTPDVINSWSETFRGRKAQAQFKPHVQRNDYIKISKAKKTEIPSQIPKPMNTLSENQLKGRQINKGLLHKGISTSAKKQLTPTAYKSRVTSNPLASGAKMKSLIRTEPRRQAWKRVDGGLYSNKASAANDVANQIIDVLSSDRPSSGSGSSSQSSSRASTPKLQAIDDPIEALDDTAFVSRDLLPRTPAPKEKYAPSPYNRDDDDDDDDDDTLKQSSLLSQQKPSNSKSLNRSGRLLKTILNQTNEPLTAAKVKTSLFPPSPEEQVNSSFTKMLQALDFNKESPMSTPSIIESMFGKDELLLSPFAFETPKPSRVPVDGEEEDILELNKNTLLTPFSFVTPLFRGDSGRNEAEYLSPFEKTQKSDYKGPTTEPCGTPNKINGTDSFQNTITLTPSTASEAMHAHTPSELSDAREEKLQFSDGKLTNQIETLGQNLSSNAPSLTVASPSFDTRNQYKGMGNAVKENKLSPRISLFTPTIDHNGDGDFVTSEDETSRQLEKKNSPFGGLEMSDNEDVEDTAEDAKTLTKGNLANESSYKDMKESDLMNRLNKIKQAQRLDFMYSSPGRSSTKTDREIPGEEQNGSVSGTTVRDVTIETLHAKRLDQILETQRGQQVTPGADTCVTLEPDFRRTETVPLTPLTPGSRGSDHLNSEHAEKFPSGNNQAFSLGATETPSDGSTPTSMLSERFFLKSPFGNEKDDYFNVSPLPRVFTLDSPVPSPDVDQNRFTPKLRTPLDDNNFNSLTRTSDYGTRLVHFDPNGSLSKDFSTKQGFRPTIDKLESGSTLLSANNQDGTEDSWLSSHATPRAGLSISSDRNLGYDDFLSLQEPAVNGTKSPAIGQLIDL